MTAAGQAASGKAVAEIIQVSGRKFNFLGPPAGLVVLLPSWPANRLPHHKLIPFRETA
jgi:hypothetical protein